MKEEAEVESQCHIVLLRVQVRLQEKEDILYGEKDPTNNLEIYPFKSNLQQLKLNLQKQRKFQLKLHRLLMIHITLNHQSRTNWDFSIIMVK
jgi:hypothetical protein